MSVDPTPQAARGARAKVRAALLGIAGLGLLGASLGAAIAVHLTTPTPKES